MKHFLIVNEGLRAGCQIHRANGEGLQSEQPMGGLLLWVDKWDPLFNYLGVTVLEWGAQDSRQHREL